MNTSVIRSLERGDSIQALSSEMQVGNEKYLRLTAITTVSCGGHLEFESNYFDLNGCRNADNLGHPLFLTITVGPWIDVQGASD